METEVPDVIVCVELFVKGSFAVLFWSLSIALTMQLSEYYKKAAASLSMQDCVAIEPKTVVR